MRTMAGVLALTAIAASAPSHLILSVGDFLRRVDILVRLLFP